MDKTRTNTILSYAGVNAATLVMDCFCAATDAINHIYLDAFRKELVRLLKEYDAGGEWMDIAKRVAEEPV